LVDVLDYFQAKKSAKLAFDEHEQQLNTVLYHSKQPPFRVQTEDTVSFVQEIRRKMLYFD
jgi:hypothetical protein